MGCKEVHQVMGIEHYSVGKCLEVIESKYGDVVGEVCGSG